LATVDMAATSNNFFNKSMVSLATLSYWI